MRPNASEQEKNAEESAGTALGMSLLGGTGVSGAAPLLLPALVGMETASAVNTGVHFPQKTLTFINYWRDKKYYNT